VEHHQIHHRAAARDRTWRRRISAGRHQTNGFLESSNEKESGRCSGSGSGYSLAFWIEPWNEPADPMRGTQSARGGLSTAVVRKDRRPTSELHTALESYLDSFRKCFTEARAVLLGIGTAASGCSICICICAHPLLVPSDSDSTISIF
jgi:hypothetical protein